MANYFSRLAETALGTYQPVLPRATLTNHFDAPDILLHSVTKEPDRQSEINVLGQTTPVKNATPTVAQTPPPKPLPPQTDPSTIPVEKQNSEDLLLPNNHSLKPRRHRFSTHAMPPPQKLPDKTNELIQPATRLDKLPISF